MSIDKNTKLKYAINHLAMSNYYEYQSVRIATMGRLRNIIFRHETGLEWSDLQEKKKLTEEEKQYLKEYADKKLPKKIRNVLDSLEPQEQDYISKLLDLVDDAGTKEQDYKRAILSFVKTEPIYTEWLEHLKGVGEMITAGLLYYFGYCEKARHASSLTAFAGITPNSKKVKGERITYNPNCKVLMWRLSDMFIKHRTPKYRAVYDEEKARQLQRIEDEADNAPASLGHADKRARRKAVKYFLIDYWLKCAELTGRAIEPPYNLRDKEDWVKNHPSPVPVPKKENV